MPLSRTSRTKVAEVPRLEGEFLENVHTAQAFVTLTRTSHASRLKLHDDFQRWTRGLQKHNRLTVGWIKAVEPSPRRHIHIILFAGKAIDCAHAEDLWRAIVAPRYLEAARVDPYAYGIGGAAYVLKSLDRDYEDVQFSPNLIAFYPDSEHLAFGSNRSERRQIRRIRAQSSVAASAPLPSPRHLSEHNS